MLSRLKRSSALEQELADEIFHSHAIHWRSLVEPVRELDETGKPRPDPAAERKPRRSYWSPWLWVK
jgi:hypothetical protein